MKSYFKWPEDTESSVVKKAQKFSREISIYFDALEIFEDLSCAPDVIMIGRVDIPEAKVFYQRMESEGMSHIVEREWGLELTAKIRKAELPTFFEIASFAKSPSRTVSKQPTTTVRPHLKLVVSN